MATKKTCYCVGDLEERRKELGYTDTDEFFIERGNR